MQSSKKGGGNPPPFLLLCMSHRSHIVALAAIAVRCESIFAIMASATRLATFHGAHAEVLGCCFEGEQFGVAIVTFEHPQVELVAELRFPSLGFEGDDAGLEAFVALIALAGYRKGILAIVAGATRLALFHVGHGCMSYPSFVWEDLGMAVIAFKHAEMDIVAEIGISKPFDLEDNFTGLHAFVAVPAIAGNTEGLFPIVAGTAGFSLFHLSHGYSLALGCYHFAIMAGAAFATCFAKVKFVAERHIGDTCDLEGDGAWLPFVTHLACAVVFDTEGLDT